MRAYTDFIHPDTGEVIAAKYSYLDADKLAAIEAAIGLPELERRQTEGILLVLHDVDDECPEPGWRNPSELTNLTNWVARRKYEIAAAPWIAHCEWLAVKGEEA